MGYFYDLWQWMENWQGKKLGIKKNRTAYKNKSYPLDIIIYSINMSITLG
jgi:hypothetical protein